LARLSDKLVKEFVRMTNDTSKKKSESFLYGTVDSIEEDGTVNVILDGSDIPTPCSASVSVAEGDRVLLMLKNRQGVITSNVTNPTVNAGYLEAGEAKISGTIHAATYEDSTGNFTMDIGTTEDPYGSVSPAFRIGGYINGNPSNDYLELVISLFPPADPDTPFPALWIEGRISSEPGDEYANRVNMGIDDTGIHFKGAWGDTPQAPGLNVHKDFSW